jgi:CubicO group peptidase (beta-lactamase class C family)
MKAAIAVFGVLVAAMVVALSSCTSDPQVAHPDHPPTADTAPTIRPTISPIPITSTPHLTFDESAIVEQVDAYLSDLYQQKRFNGTFLVAHEGQIIFHGFYGFADRKQQLPITNETRFYIGQLTKQFTAASILLLEQDGKLNVHDPICQYLNNCPDEWQPITIHHLLTHTSGLPYELGWMPCEPTDPIELQQIIAQREIRREPGEYYEYSSPGYILAGRIVEEVSGMTYGEFLHKRIFEPLKMTSSSYGTPCSDCAEGYYASADLALKMEPSIQYSAAGIYSTAEDLLRWDQALNTDILLTDSSRGRMFTGYAPIEGIPQEWEYGYGWILGEFEGHQWIAHAGSLTGFRSVLDRYVDDGYTFITLANQQNIDIGPIRAECIRIALDIE